METRMNEFEVQAFAAFVKYHMPMEMRHAMMQALPGVYNKLIGREVVKTSVVEEGSAK